jgi:hypothetical protein
MNERKRNRGRFARKRAWLVAAIAVFCLGWATDSFSDNRVILLPRLHAGQALRYQINARVQRAATTQSRVNSMTKPPDLKEEISLGLQITIKEIRMVNGRPIMVAHGEMQIPDDSGGKAAAPAPAIPKLDFTIDGSGQVQRVEGLDDLQPEQRLIWQFWIARFAYGWTLPAEGVRLGQKWKTEEPEKTPGPIANLAWEQETTYGQNDRCATVPAEKCAVFLTTATLKQKSSPKDATPEEFKLRELKTRGIANGTDEVYTSISLRTGLVLRATEDGKQTMDVEIAKADGTNGIHYTVNVNSRFEMVMLPEATASRR